MSIESNVKDILKFRNVYFKKIRQYFENNDCLEIQTPILNLGASPDPYIDPFQTSNFYLHTSPELNMKKLLSKGCGDIFQICPVFRQGENGNLHYREFTMLEWYRTEYTTKDLMNDIHQLFNFLLGQPIKAEYLIYHDLFRDIFKIDIDDTNSLALLKTKVADDNIDSSSMNKDDCLNYLFSFYIESAFSDNCITFVDQYPASQAILSRINDKNPLSSDRFEVFWGNIELGNGFLELIGKKAHQNRFNYFDQIRNQKRLNPIKWDQEFLDISDYIPNCSGVAIGLDRLFMKLENKKTIKEVLPIYDEF